MTNHVCHIEETRRDENSFQGGVIAQNSACRESSAVVLAEIPQRLPAPLKYLIRGRGARSGLEPCRMMDSPSCARRGRERDR